MSITTTIASTVASSTTGSASAKLSIGSTVYLTASINSTTTLDVTSTVSVISSTNYTKYETITLVVGNGSSKYTSTVVVSDVHLIAGTYTLKLHKYIHELGDNLSYPEWEGEATIPTRNTVATITPVSLTTTAAGINNALSYILTVNNIATATSSTKAQLVGEFVNEVTTSPKSTTVMPSTTATDVTTTYIINSTSTYSKVISVVSTSTDYPNNVTGGLQWFFQYKFTDSTGWVTTLPVRTYYVTSSYNSSYRFTILVNGTKLYAPFNIACERSIYSAGELDFSITPKDMKVTSTSSFTTTYSVNKGDTVTFWYLGNLVFTGTIENIKKKNTNQYDLIAYDKLYYLTAVRKTLSLGVSNKSSTVSFGVMISNIFSGTSTAVTVPTTTYEGFGYKLTNTISPYFSLMQLSNLLGYKFGSTATNLVALSKIYNSSTTTVLTENNNNWIPKKRNDVNYGYNQIYVTANDYTTTNDSKLTTSSTSKESTTGQITSKSLVFNWLYLAGDKWSKLITSTGGESLTTSVGNTSTLAKQGLVILGSYNQQGYLSASTWFNLQSLPISSTGLTQAKLLNLSEPNRFTIKFSDKSTWSNLFLSKYTITSSGLMLTLVNMHQDLWSLMNTVTATNG
jgi:hypothetical protein